SMAHRINCVLVSGSIGLLSHRALNLGQLSSELCERTATGPGIGSDGDRIGFGIRPVPNGNRLVNGRVAFIFSGTDDNGAVADLSLDMAHYYAFLANIQLLRFFSHRLLLFSSNLVQRGNCVTALRAHYTAEVDWRFGPLRPHQSPCASR